VCCTNYVGFISARSKKIKKHNFFFRSLALALKSVYLHRSNQLPQFLYASAMGQRYTKVNTSHRDTITHPYPSEKLLC
jgi:hypothetical protein